MNKFHFVCFILYTLAVCFAELDDKSEEELDSLTMIQTSNETLEEERPPDSHEAMSQRRNPLQGRHQKIRERRSYEFLMGLINNNSKFELTKNDQFNSNSNNNNNNNNNNKLIEKEEFEATELLLELMVRIAANPNQWEKVHNLLEKIDKDISTSKSILNELKTNPQQKRIKVEGHTVSTTESTSSFKKEKWPDFEKSQPKKPYQNAKNFAYHRVTGKPIYLNKNPKAYIAVSVIAPKTKNTAKTVEKDANLDLEDELKRLKPWTHEQNLKDMETLRSRWLIKSGK
ncbi:serine/threonine-protein kinase pakG-like isoform X2 [Aethina tumida]|uniref:serine/threonine-protein kinase pakG-like isoform X2 n=1 Tax=Aethina tumida TaxID=116153 RepID=UPI00096B3E47|nr:serine/threonine-protein kinase pakG-like isoform X2 [Aethina tumida]